MSEAPEQTWPIGFYAPGDYWGTCAICGKQHLAVFSVTLGVVVGSCDPENPWDALLFGGGIFTFIGFMIYLSERVQP